MLNRRNFIVKLLIATIVSIAFWIQPAAYATTQQIQLNGANGYTVQTTFSYKSSNLETIAEGGKGKTKVIDSLTVNFYNPSGEAIASYNNIVDGVARGNYFQFNFDPATQKLWGEIDLGGELAGEMYLKGEVEGELSLIEVEASGKERIIDVIER